MDLTDAHAKFYAHELTRKCPSDSVEKLIGVLSDAQVDLNPHQVDAALFAFKSPLSQGAILADEVGLGKTIEAGILLSQKWAEKKRKILIITPAGLRKQWQQELSEKFFIDSMIIEAKSFNELHERHSNPFEQDCVVILSYHFARNKEEYVKRIKWDLAVIDEAHRLRNVYKNTNVISKSIKKSLEGIPKVLLTATPLQNSLLELYGLISFIDEYTFGDIASFKEQFVRVSDENKDNFQDLKDRLSSICKRTLRRQVLEYIRYTNRISITQEFLPNEDEQKLYDSVLAYLQRDQLYALPKQQRKLMTLIMLKLLASSTFAISGTLRALITKLNLMLSEGVDEDIRKFIRSDYEELDDLEDEWGEETPEEKKKVQLSEADKEAVRKEISELSEFSKLAESIRENSKGIALQKALDKGFAKLSELGAPQKAIIFTESRRTQKYLFDLLSQTQYKDQLVCFNGTNNDAASKQIYREWLQKHYGTDRISGSASADRRSAIVDCFREKASIMIATEAGAEGINLQFCSLVVNYDLPWNPQRIEQRIGRCHRYGQKYDVVVINFLNQKNDVDQRVYEILSEKFKLFEGVFGASDEVLGSIESGVDFESRVVAIYSECRTSEQITKAFDELQKELESEITEGLESARRKLLENFDEEVHEKLRVNQSQSKDYLNLFERHLWDLTKYSISGRATFDDDNKSFMLTAPVFDIKNGRFKMGKQVEDAHLYRLGHPLAQGIIAEAKHLNVAPNLIEFDYGNYPHNIAVLEDLLNKHGELALWKVTVSAFEEEEYMIFVGAVQDGITLSQEQCQKMFNLPGKVLSSASVKADTLQQAFASKKNELLVNLTERNGKFFDTEMEKLDKWSDDKRKSLRKSLKDLDDQIKEMKKQARLTTNLADKLKMQKKIRDLDKKRDDAMLNYEKRKKDVDNEADSLLDKIQSRMEAKVNVEQLLAIGWRVV